MVNAFDPAIGRRNIETLAALHCRAQEATGSDHAWEDFRSLSRILLRILARENFSAPPPDRLARHVHHTVREAINDRLAAVSNGQSVSMWLTRTLQAIDDEKQAVQLRSLYAQWVSAAGRALTAILQITDPGNSLPGSTVKTYTSRVYGNITSSLDSLSYLRTEN